MNFRTTLILLALLLIVGAFFFIDMKRTPSSLTAPATDDPTAQRGAGQPLFTADTFSTQSIKTIKITRDGKTTTLVREGTDWKMTSPVRFPVDSWAIQRLVDAANELRYTDKITAGGKSPSLEDMGLVKPGAVVEFIAPDVKASTHSIKLGMTNLAGRAYLQLDDKPEAIVVADSLHKAVLDAKPEDWRKRTLESPSEAQAEAVELRGEKIDVNLSKNGGEWTLAMPHSGRVDTEAVRTLLSSISGAYIDKFIADQPADGSMYGFDIPTVVVSARVPAPAPTTQASQPAAPTSIVKRLTVGSPVDLTKATYFATWSVGDEPGEVVFTLNKATVDKLTKDADALRDARITPLKPSDIRELKIESAGKTMARLQRGADGWAFGDPDPGFKADSAAVTSFIDAIAGTKATGYATLNEPPVPSLPAAHVLTLHTAGRSEPDVLRFFSASVIAPAASQPADLKASPWHVFRNNEAIGYLVSRDKAARLIAPVIALRDRMAIDNFADRLSKITIRQSDGVEFVFERQISITPASQPATSPAVPMAKPTPHIQLGPWRLAGHDKHETSSIEDAIRQTLPLRVEKWLTETPKPPTKPVTITLNWIDIAPRTITIDAATRSGSADGINAPFQVSAKLVEALTQEFRDRMVTSIKLADVKEIAVTRAGKMITLSKDSAGKYVSSEGEAIDQAAAGAIFDTLTGLRALRYPAAPETLGDDPITYTITTHDGPAIGVIVSATRNAVVKLKKPGEPAAALSFTLDDAVLRKLRAELAKAVDSSSAIPAESDSANESDDGSGGGGMSLE